MKDSVKLFTSVGNKWRRFKGDSGYVYLEIPSEYTDSLVSIFEWAFSKLYLNNISVEDVVLVDDTNYRDLFRELIKDDPSYLEDVGFISVDSMSKEEVYGELTMFDYYVIDISNLVGKDVEYLVYVGDDDTIKEVDDGVFVGDIWTLDRGINPEGYK